MKNSDFLVAAYGDLHDDYGWTASFPSDPNDPAAGAWAGQPWAAKTTQRMFIDAQPANNNFFSVGVMHSDSPKRTKGLFKRLAVLLADDADPGALMGPTSYILETSLGNYQIGVFLDPEDPDASDGPLIDIVLSYMASRGIVNADASGNNPVRYGRLPDGRNTKKSARGFISKLHHFDGDLVYSLEDAAAAFGIDLDAARAWAKNPPVNEIQFTNPKMDSAEAFRQLINPDLAERSYHDPLLKISAGLVAKGMTPEGALGTMRSIMLAIKPESGPELDRWQARFGADLQRMVKGAEKYAPEQISNDGSIVLTLDELEARTLNVNWLVKGLVPSDSIGMLFGGSGTYKSFISLDLALHIAHGMDWTGRRTQEGAVLIVAAEGGAGIFRRVQAWHLHHNLERTKNVYVCITPLILSEEHSMEVLRNSIAKMPVKPILVIIDTLSQTFSGVENDSSDISAYLRSINSELRAEFSTSVMIVHHSGHSVSERPRGSSALIGNLDYILGVFRPEGDERTARLSVVKQKDGDKVDDLYWDMRHLVLGVDEDNEEISSLVAECTREAPGHGARGGKYEGAIMLALHGGPRTNQELKVATESLSDNPRTAQKGLREALKKLESAKQIRALGGGSAWALVPAI